MIEESLRQLGLDEKETVVYLTVLKQGKTRAAALARSLGFKRTTVYSVAKELLTKGLIKEDLGEPVLSYLATEPGEIFSLIRKEEKLLEQKKKTAAAVVENLEKLAGGKQTLIPKIIFVPSHQIEKHLYKQTPLWAESIKRNGGTWWGFQDHTFVENYETWIDWSWESGVQKGINLKLISNQQERHIKKKTFADREIKFWSANQNFTASMWVCGEYVINLVTNKKPHYLVEQHDALMAKNLREVFKGIWKTQIEK